MTPRADTLPARALERLLRDAVLAGKTVRIKDGEIVINGEEAEPINRLDLVDFGKRP